MAFFGLSDINFNPDGVRDFDSLPILNDTSLSSSGFGTNILKYPMDVGSANKGHYMLFFVREQKNTQFSVADRGGNVFSKTEEESIQQALTQGVSVSSNVRTPKLSNPFAERIQRGIERAAAPVVNTIYNKFGNSSPIFKGIAGDINKFVLGKGVSLSEETVNNEITTSVKRITDKSGFEQMNRTMLTTDTIALYMPDTVQFDSRQSYDGLSPGKELLGQALVALPGLIDTYKKGGARAALSAIKNTGALQAIAERVIGNVTGAPDTTRLAAFTLSGRVVNPMLELIYNSPDFRQFQFEFFFWPRDKKEATEVQKIIERFRFHQAPELEKISGKQSGLLIPPSEFDIQFFYAGRQNPNIPPIASCVLESIQVNYAPRGWSAYEVPGENNPDIGRTGMPVGIQLTLQFRETTYITKEDFGFQPTDRSTPSPSMPSGPEESGQTSAVPMNPEFDQKELIIQSQDRVRNFDGDIDATPN